MSTVLIIENLHPHAHNVTPSCLIAPEPKLAELDEAEKVAHCVSDPSVEESGMDTETFEERVKKTVLGRGGDACKVTNVAESLATVIDETDGKKAARSEIAE